MSAPFVHLNLHTEYSLVDGLVRVKPLMEQVHSLGMPAVAMTDQSNMFAMVKFYKAALAKGIKPIFGAEVGIEGKSDRMPIIYRVQLLCIDKAGYLNLSEIISRAYQHGQGSGSPLVERAWLEEFGEGLIALSGGVRGEIGQFLLSGNQPALTQSVQFWKHSFPGRFYLELQRTSREDEQCYTELAVKLALDESLPVVATNDVRFLLQSEFDAHEARTCIRDGYVLADPKRPKRYSDSQYLKSPEEMQELFSDLPEAIENTLEIAKRCNVVLELGKNVLPDFPIPEGMTESEFFNEEARKGLEERLLVLQPVDTTKNREEACKPYHERLEIELGVINQMGFPGYFLIVADFIQWAKDNDVPVGPGRGSGAGSLVAYALKITDIDPLQYDLLFERFLNPERVSMPDFDIDFCMDKRDDVINYVAEHYGREKVSQIITYGSMAAKAVVRDVGRVLAHPYGFVDRIAKLIPFEIGITLDKALAQEEELQKLYDTDEEVKALIDLAKQLEGLARNAGKHAGGVVIAPTKLTDFSPLYCEPGGGNLVTQFDKDDVEAVGLVKFDFLGLRTLTIIDWAVKAINASGVRDEPLDISRLVLDDAATFKLLKAQQTTAIFQLESRGMKDLIKRLQPDDFEDIVALVALFRPGPLQSGMVDDFIERKHGRSKVEYPHPDLEPILEPTYGVILYQEQVMQIAQILANYSLGGADLLRRAMGKKKVEEMEKQRDIFLKGSAERGVEEKIANYIFDLMEKFAGYGFNKSHSAAYALLSYQTAWLKSHYPAPFMAAVLSADMDNTDKVVILVDDCRSMSLKVDVPDINQSNYKFVAAQDNQGIVYGLGAIKGVGEGAIECIVDERSQNGKYASLDDLCCRIDTHKANRRVLEAMIKGGAMDSLGHTRASLLTWLPDALSCAEQHQRDAASGQNDLFGGAVAVIQEYKREAVPEWDEHERLRLEKETLGLYLTGHPIERHLDELKVFTTCRLGELEVDAAPPQNKYRSKEKPVVVAGLLTEIRTRNGARGRMGFITLDDRSARVEVAIFGEDYETYASLLIKDHVLVVSGSLGFDHFSGQNRIRATEVLSIEQARGKYARYLEVVINQQKLKNGATGELQTLLKNFNNGLCPVIMKYQNGNASANIKLGNNWLITPTDDCLKQLRSFAGEDNVTIRYS